LVVGVLISTGGSLWLRQSDRAEAVVDDPGLRGAVPSVPLTTAPASSTTTVVPAPVVTDTRVTRSTTPVRVPVNPRQREPLIEIGTIEIPKIGLTHRLFEGISLTTIDQGPSHWPGTALPGQVGNAVFAGHRVTHSRPFRNIDQLQAGDEVIFNIGGARTVYEMTGSQVVTPKALDIVNPTPTPTATLFACHPPGSARYRYVVRLALKGS
ncbi:MAG TPA: class E sortase, partial [Acidimicrobiales bacterium]|nr:class E sortase [Acidimicrobiales bacterium]